MGTPKEKGANKKVPTKGTKNSEVVKTEVAATEEKAEIVQEEIKIGELQAKQEDIVTAEVLGALNAKNPVMQLVNPEHEALKVECAKLTEDVQKSENVVEALTSELEKALAGPEYLVVIPYKESEAQGNELELAIRSWGKYFKENFTLVVVGDHHGEMAGISDDYAKRIIHLPHVCITDNPPLDIVAKLQLVIETFPEHAGLILTNDDIYPINDFDITEVKLLKSEGLLTDVKKVGEVYAANRAKTLKAIMDIKEASIYDYGSHTPVYLDAEKLLELIEKFNLTEEAYLLTSLYFNYFYPTRIPFKLDMDKDNLKVIVGRPNANLRLLADYFMPVKIWINNTTAGWSNELAELIAKRLG